MIPDVYSGVSLEDLKTLKDNKINYGNTTNPIYKDVYNLNNKNIRNYYGISEDDDVSLGTLNNYIALREKQENKNTLLKNITGSAYPGKAVTQTADEVKNFKYDPNTDPAYKSYADMYNRQGQSAAKSTLNQLNAASGGRNNSFSSAATAQVQQAYAQKASEMIPALAEQAYNRLLQKYNIERDIDDTRYNRELTAYQALADDESRTLQNEAAILSNEASRLGNEASKIQLEALPEQIKLDIESGKLANEISSLQLEGLTYENRIAAVSAEIQEKLGLPMAQADYVAKVLSSQKTSRSGSGGVKTSNIDKVIKGINDALKSKPYYNELVNAGYINEGDDIVRGSNGVYALGNGFSKGSWGQPIVQALYNAGLAPAEVGEAIRLLGLEEEWTKFTNYGL